MADRDGIFGGDDPFAIARAWMTDAASTEPNDPNAVALATVDGDGLPNVRIVLLKEIAADGLVFYTNYESPKAMEIEQAGKAAMVLHWKTLRRQIRARGRIARVPAEVSDAYFATRPLESRLGAWASRQSQPLGSRRDLEAALDAARSAHGDSPPRPARWGGYKLVPTAMEFWADGAFRLHDRFAWSREEGSEVWTVARLSP